MNQFPRYFPGKLSSIGVLECPVCKEQINGLTNLFVLEDSETANNCDYQCPYNEVLTKHVTAEIGCTKKMKLSDLHKHLIQFHNQTVKCPNCSTWLCDGEKNMEDLLQLHIMKNCQTIKCHGCDRTGGMLNMYLHSIIGRDNACCTAKQMFTSFGNQLSDCFYVFEETENITQLSIQMMTWMVQYLYQRHIGPDIGVEVFGRQFHRIFYGFLLQVFVKIHAPLMNTDIVGLLNKILKLAKSNNADEYQEDILLMTSEFAKQHNQRLDRISKLPFSYRILVMTMSDFSYAKRIASKYPKNISAEEQSEISRLIELFEAILPEDNSQSTITFQIPDVFRSSSIQS